MVERRRGSQTDEKVLAKGRMKKEREREWSGGGTVAEEEERGTGESGGSRGRGRDGTQFPSGRFRALRSPNKALL